MVGVRKDEVDGASFQLTFHRNERTLGQKASRWDSIAKSWMVSRDTQARERFWVTTGWEYTLSTTSAVTRAVYLLNRFHSSWERFLDKDWKPGKACEVNRKVNFLRTKTLSETDQESAGRVLRMVIRTVWRRHKTSMTGSSSDLQQHARASNDADPPASRSAQ